MKAIALKFQSQMETLRILRNVRYLVFTLLVPIGYYLIFANTYASSQDLQLHFEVAMAGFGTIGVSFGSLVSRIVQERQAGWLKLLRTTPLTSAAYFLAKLIAVFITSGIVIVGVFIVALIQGLRPHDFGQLIESGLILWACSLPFITLSFIIGYWVDADTSYVVSLAVYFVMAYLGGLLEPLQIMPRFLQDIARFIPTEHYLALALRPFGVPALSSVGEDILVLAAYFIVFTLLGLWGYYRDLTS